MKRNLYIDTNVYLTFFHFSSEDLNELKKLITLINTNHIALYVPEQTKNEFDRNREIKIADSLVKLKEMKLDVPFPMICHAYEEYSSMKTAIKKFETDKGKLLDKLQHDAEKGVLKADDVLNQLLDKAIYIETSPEVLNDSVTRFNVGNPPGKDKSYGDAINWVSLMRALPVHEDLYFISDDKDYYSKLNTKMFNSYLSREWKEAKNSQLLCYRRLSEFFKDIYPNIEISDETEKDIVIMSLFEANSFSSAKNAIRTLRKYNDFSVQQLNDIASAFSTNNQIHWIKNHSTVSSARIELIEANADKIDFVVYELYKRIYETKR